MWSKEINNQQKTKSALLLISKCELLSETAGDSNSTGNSSTPTAGNFIKHDTHLSSFFSELVKERELYDQLLGPKAANFTVFAPSNEVFGRALNDTLKSNKSIKEYLQSSIVRGIKDHSYDDLSEKDPLQPLRSLYTIAIRKNGSGTYASLVNTGDVFDETHSVLLSNNKSSHRYFESKDGVCERWTWQQASWFPFRINAQNFVLSSHADCLRCGSAIGRTSR